MNLEIPGAGKPYIPHPKYKRYWARTDLPWMSIGYVSQMPPIYTLAFYNAIANDGKLIRPRFVKCLKKGNKIEKEMETEVLNPAICSQRTLTQIRAMLDSVVTRGTGKNIKSPFVSIAGKTGTAQLAKGKQGYKSGGLSYQVSFCGYFPADTPQYCGIVVIREPRNELPSGGRQAGGVFKEIAERIYARQARTPVKLQDSTIRTVPKMLSGNNLKIRSTLDQMGIPYRWIGKEGADWVRVTGNMGRITLIPYAVVPRVIPDVTGMGARDAVHLLGDLGLRVHLSGRGQVVSQSMVPGTFYKRGQTISLVLE
jgi:cell division protein FtsI (penicillin-binding protein 3)